MSNVLTIPLAVLLAGAIGLREGLDGAQMLMTGLLCWLVAQATWHSALALLPRRGRRRR